MFAVVACDKKDDATPQAPLQTSVVSSLQKSAFKTSGEDLQVQIVEVNDSRCPMNAVCIVAGSADIKFTIANATDKTEVHVMFGAMNNNTGSQDFKLGGQTYNITVTEVLPYPETSKTPKLEDYKVAVSVVKK